MRMLQDNHAGNSRDTDTRFADLSDPVAAETARNLDRP